MGYLEDERLIPRQDALLAALGLPLTHQLGAEVELESLQDRCRLDKKVSAGQTRFVLPSALGQVAMVSDPDPAAVRQGFTAGCVFPEGAAS